MALPNTSPDMSPIPTTVTGSDWTSISSSAKWWRTATHAPRAVMPRRLWSYPLDPPDAKASPSQKPRSVLTRLARSENDAVPRSAATTR